jgi:hypothetical protein
MSTEIWNRLLYGKPLSERDVPTVDGRFDLRNLHVPEPHAVETVRTPLADVTVLGGITSIEHATWHSIEFSSSQFGGTAIPGLPNPQLCIRSMSNGRFACLAH